MSSQSPKTLERPLPSDSDSEWEYEYSTTETETHYITLDISSLSSPHSSLPQQKKRQKRFHATGNPLKRRPPATQQPQTDAEAQAEADAGAEAETAAEGNETAAEAGGSQTEPGVLTENENENENGAATEEADEPEKATVQDEQQASELQILDLHSKNPLIAYQGQIYSCTWTQPLGTDIVLKPPLSASTLNDPKEQGIVQRNGAEARSTELPSPILALSEIRLMARPMQAVPWSEVRRGKTGRGKGAAVREGEAPRVRFASPARKPPDSSADGTSSMPNDVEDTAVPSARPASPSQQLLQSSPPPVHSLLSSLTPYSTPARAAQANFLTKLMTAKQSLGEADSVTVYATKPPTGTGWSKQPKARDSGKGKGGGIVVSKGKQEQELVLVEDDDDDDDGGDEEEREEQGKGEGEGDGGSVSKTAWQKQKQMERKVKKATLRVKRKDRFSAYRTAGRRSTSKGVQRLTGDTAAAHGEGADVAMSDAGGEDRS